MKNWIQVRTHYINLDMITGVSIRHNSVIFYGWKYKDFNCTFGVGDGFYCEELTQQDFDDLIILLDKVLIGGGLSAEKNTA